MWKGSTMSKKRTEPTYQMLPLFAEAFPVPVCRWLENVRDWMTSKVDSGGNFGELSWNLSQDTSLSRMCLVYSVPMEAETSPSYLQDLPENFQKFLKRDGETADSEKADRMPITSHGAFWTLSSAEYHNDGVESSLSDVLLPAESIPPKYFLSPRACAGILRRAEKRGKELPPQLAQILRHVVMGGLTQPKIILSLKIIHHPYLVRWRRAGRERPAPMETPTNSI